MSEVGPERFAAAFRISGSTPVRVTAKAAAFLAALATAGNGFAAVFSSAAAASAAEQNGRSSCFTARLFITRTFILVKPLIKRYVRKVCISALHTARAIAGH